MGVVQAVVTVCGVLGIIGLLLILFCHYFHGWTWTTNYIFNSTKEEKMVLTKPGHYNSNGCMIPSSDSDFHLSGRGSFRRFDKTDQDYSLLSQGSCSSLTRPTTNLPPQPLRPAPTPPYITCPLRSQGSLDSVFSSGPSSPSQILPTSSILRKQVIPIVKPRGEGSGAIMSSGGFANLSANNPFLPLIQASTQFLSQKFQSFQSQPNGTDTEFPINNPLPPIRTNPTSFNNSKSHSLDQEYPKSFNNSKSQSLDQEYPKGLDGSINSSRNSYESTSTIPSSAGLSMGEILFSSPPAYSLPEKSPQSDNKQDHIMQEILHGLKNQSQMLYSTAESCTITKEDENKETPTQVIPDPNGIVFYKGLSEKERHHADTNIGNHLESKKHSMSNFSSKADYAEHFYTNDHQKSPTRLRDRQRKMEFTLQHLQNNHEDRSVGKKHYNPDSCYPISTPYVPKHVENGSDNGMGINSKCRFRPPYGIGNHPVPPVTEIEETIDHGSPLKIDMSHSSEISDLRSIIPEVEEEEEENEVAKSKSFLETMREEIRLENERMADATKSLMMEEDFSSEKFRSNGTTTTAKYLPSKPYVIPSLENSNAKKEVGTGTMSISTKPVKRLSSTEEEEDAGKTSYTSSNNANGDLNANSNLISSQSPLTIPDSLLSAVKNFTNSVPTSLPVSLAGTAQQILDGGLLSNQSLANNIPQVRPPFRNTRSFSLRQSSTDSIGSEGSDVASPDGSSPSLQRAMSCDSVSSDTSVILGDLEPPHVTGHLCIGLEYDSETADLLVNVVEAKELVGPDPSSLAPFDSYVRVYLLPDKTTNMQTRVYRKSFNPIYREKFMFGLETMELPLRTLVFYLYGTDKHSNTLVGEAELKLGDLNIHQPTTTWLQLTDTGQKGGESGEIMFSLSYLPTAERLTVVVVKARNLKFPHQRETGDPFVKVYLLQRGKKVSKKKSSTKRGERNPIFSEAMIFSVPAHALNTIQLRITVADSSEIEGRAYSVGHVIVGASASGKSLSHWNQMLASLRKPIAMWHPLRK